MLLGFRVLCNNSVLVLFLICELLLFVFTMVVYVPTPS